jgi:hypothetical protein
MVHRVADHRQQTAVRWTNIGKLDIHDIAGLTG